MAKIGISTQLQTALGQHMLLLPRMLQSIEILQIPSQELATWLREAAEENAALQLEERDPELAQAGARRPDAEPRHRRGTREDSERHAAFLENQPERAKSLFAQIEEQLALLDVDERLLAWVRLLVGCLDEHGYLSAPHDFLLAEARERGLAGGERELEQALAVLHGLEPRGLGARNAVEALLMQIDPADPDHARLCRLLEGYLDEIARNKLPGVARAMGLDLCEVQRLIERLRSLDPRPAAQLDREAAPPLHPDVLVLRSGDSYEVHVDATGHPAVRLDPAVTELAKDRGQSQEVKRYLRDKIDRARWIIEAVEQRRATLARIAARLFERQRPFLDQGPGHLAPLRMTDLAAELGIHVSTVSRAVAGKYAQTAWGIFPLRSFFQAAGGADEGTARDDVRAAVQALFESEDRTQPLADDDVVRAMAERGWTLARRTVAKYRKELGIPSSYRRRVYG
jgi:RNA polymerase sigma-54 factor